MSATKKSYGFRISAQAEDHLNRIVYLTGMTKTSAVEMAIVQLSQSLKGAEMSNLMDDDIREAAFGRGARLPEI